MFLSRGRRFTAMMKFMTRRGKGGSTDWDQRKENEGSVGTRKRN